MHGKPGSFARAAACGALLVGIAACGALGPDDPLAGSYTLVRVNGEAPPVVVYDEVDNGTRVRGSILGGELILDGGRYDLAIQVAITWNGEPVPSQPLTDAGEYEGDGSGLTFRPDGGGSAASAIVDGDELRLSDSHAEFGSFELVFRR